MWMWVQVVEQSIYAANCCILCGVLAHFVSREKGIQHKSRSNEQGNGWQTNKQNVFPLPFSSFTLIAICLNVCYNISQYECRAFNDFQFVRVNLGESESSTVLQNMPRVVMLLLLLLLVSRLSGCLHWATPTVFPLFFRLVRPRLLRHVTLIFPIAADPLCAQFALTSCINISISSFEIEFVFISKTIMLAKSCPPVCDMIASQTRTTMNPSQLALSL